MTSYATNHFEIEGEKFRTLIKRSGSKLEDEYI